MRTIKELAKLRSVDGDVGVEIEVEGNLLPPAAKYWRVERDASLRGESAEYVLDKPVPIDVLGDRLQGLKDAFVACKSDFFDTYRAGVHVHVNVQNLDARQLFNFIVTYMVVEELLLTFCAKHRFGNHFCLPTSQAGYLVNKLSQALEKSDLKILYDDDIRYSSINVKPVVQYGSVEFRALESTSDFNKIHTWSTILVGLRDAAVTFDCPQKIMHEVSAGGYEYFIRKVFGPHAPIFMKNPNWEMLVRKGILNAQDIAFSRDWGKINYNIFSREQGW
jgi:hypothetical protein